MKQMSETKKHNSESDKEMWSWLHCRSCNAHSSRIFVIVVGVFFIVLGSVLLSQYSNKKLRDFLVLGVGMLVVGIAFVFVIMAFIVGDRCLSLCVSIKDRMSARRRVSDSNSRQETPSRFEPAPDNLYRSRPTTGVSLRQELPERDPNVVAIDATPGVVVMVPRHDV